MAKNNFAMAEKKKKTDKGKTARAKNRRGQADSMLGPVWHAWLEHVRNKGPTWLYVALCLTHLLCSRITEVMRLTTESFEHEEKHVSIAALKRQPTIAKPLSEAACLVTESLRKYGVSVQRARRNGARGHEVYLDKWTWPETGHLFPSTRRDSKHAYRTKDVVAA